MKGIRGVWVEMRQNTQKLLIVYISRCTIPTLAKTRIRLRANISCENLENYADKPNGRKQTDRQFD